MIFKIFLTTICLLLPFTAQGAVIINEIAWMGTTISYNDEWIELYNNTENNISLDGWVLKAEDGTPEVNLSGIIPEKGFYLLERTDDETIAKITADLIYKGALGNNGENLKLYDNSGNLIDEVNCQDGWLAGDNGAKLTMERTDSGWQNSQELGGTPKAVNSEQKTVNKEQIENEGENEGAKLPENETPIEYPEGIVFNKIMPSPEGSDAENEWIVPTNEHFLLCL